MHWRRKWQPTPVFLLENPRDRGAWWAAIYGVAQSRTWLKRLSSSSSSSWVFERVKKKDKCTEMTWPLEDKSVQFSSVAQSCLTLCNPMDSSAPGLPVYHQLPEFTQSLVHWVGDAFRTSHPLLSPFAPAFNLSQNQGLSNESGLHIRWPNIGISASTSVLPMNI